MEQENPGLEKKVFAQLVKNGQSHLLFGLKDLDPTKKTQYLAELNSIDYDLMTQVPCFPNS